MTPCQPYQGRISPNGYGQVWLGGKSVLAHRIAWALHNGDDPSGRIVRHSCHNRSCVNPEHLLIGTHQDNMDDRQNAGRQSRWERVNTAKLSREQVVEIRASSLTRRELAAMYGVTYMAISYVVRNKTWNFDDVPPAPPPGDIVAP